jgi:hypothetical protein
VSDNNQLRKLFSFLQQRLSAVRADDLMFLAALITQQYYRPSKKPS